MEMIRTLIGPDAGHQTAAQLSVRALVLLVFGVVCVRIAGRKTFAQASPLDIIVALVLGSNISRIMIGGAPFFPSLAATFTLVVASRLLQRAALRCRPLDNLVKGAPVVLVRDGAMNRKAMHRHGISEADLAEGLRMEQQTAVEDVRLATLEGGGKISIVPKAS